MNLAQTLKNIQQMPDSDLKTFTCEILQYFGDGSSSCEIQVSRNFWGWGWDKYRNKTTKAIVEQKEYHEKMRELTYERTAQEKYEEDHECFYDYTVYEEHLNRLEVVKKDLTNMGFTADVQASADYKTNNDPESIWLIVSW